MEIKQIKDLMSAMGRTGIKRLSIKKDDVELELEREPTFYRGPLSEEPDFHHFSGFPKEAALAKAGLESSSHLKEKPAEEKPEEGHFVVSPMVGTFYRSPSPEDPPFIKVGDKVGPDSVVCIIEAMKVMNEVKAGAEGTVAEILIDNGHPVEFGTRLLRMV